MKKLLQYCVFYLGIAVFAAGLLLIFIFAEADGVMQRLPFVLLGFGTGIIGVGIVQLYKLRLMKNHPERLKQMEIDENDERNVRLREKAGYASWHVTLFTLAVLSMTLRILDYKTACWLSLGALFIHITSFFIAITGYNKKL